ncbi:lysoplasmalogenase family protein [Emticicia sp. BO119]|uniref:lysoplasmalogenase family protein n=1 Tax=Emticicia sp. BO119 TaxID=2757768 RepID=UPI001847B7A4|nr:lysoplasmalogenase family protein [Emticicia sp. BO119]MBA4849124.1 hypothetical protein [Emticicia sp. BO119]
MPFKLKLIYILCCLIDAIAFTFHNKWLTPFGALPVLCLLTFYYLSNNGTYKLKDYTYTLGLTFSAIADFVFEFRTIIAKVIAMVLYVFTFSFYIAIVRKEAVFSTSPKELLKLILNLILIMSPFFFVFSKVPTDYFFSSIIYMVFLSLLYINALLRKTNKSSYQWFLAGTLGFVSLTITDIYFAFVIKVPHGDLINKVLYQFAQYAIFLGVIKTNKSFNTFSAANE